MRVLTFDAYEGWKERKIKACLQDYYKTIGCDTVEMHVWNYGLPWGMKVIVILDEEGKFKEGNETTGFIMQGNRIVDNLVGTLIVCGYDEETGEERGLTSGEVRELMKSDGQPLFYV